MPRKKCKRLIEAEPNISGFNPFGCSKKNETVIIDLDEFESIRLIDYQNLSQEEASIKMGVSRPTVTRIYNNARKKISIAFIEGRSMKISSQNGEIIQKVSRCIYCNSSTDESSSLCSDLDNKSHKEQAKCIHCVKKVISN